MSRPISSRLHVPCVILCLRCATQISVFSNFPYTVRLLLCLNTYEESPRHSLVGKLMWRVRYPGICTRRHVAALLSTYFAPPKASVTTKTCLGSPGCSGTTWTRQIPVPTPKVTTASYRRTCTTPTRCRQTTGRSVPTPPSNSWPAGSSSKAFGRRYNLCLLLTL